MCEADQTGAEALNTSFGLENGLDTTIIWSWSCLDLGDLKNQASWLQLDRHCSKTTISTHCIFFKTCIPLTFFISSYLSLIPQQGHIKRQTNIHHFTLAHTQPPTGNLEFPVCLTSMFLDCSTRPEYPKRTRLHTERAQTRDRTHNFPAVRPQHQPLHHRIKAVVIKDKMPLKQTPWCSIDYNIMMLLMCSNLEVTSQTVSESECGFDSCTTALK